MSALSDLFGLVEQTKGWQKLGLLALALLLLPLTLVLIVAALVQDVWYAMVEIYYGEETPDDNDLLVDRRTEMRVLLQWAVQNPTQAAQIETLLEQPLHHELETRYFDLARSDGSPVTFAVRQYWDPNQGRCRNGIFDPLGRKPNPPLRRSTATFDVPCTAYLQEWW